jgi:putative ABC transport system permease protein
VTVVAATLPAVRASRIAPLAVIRSAAVGDPSHRRGRFAAGGVITSLGALAYGIGLARSDLAWVGVGALATFIGIFVLGPLLARPAARLLGAPVAAGFGVAGELAQQNAIRNPKRSARTGGALMVGVALVAAITVIAASVDQWVTDIVGEQFTGDFAVSTSMVNFGGLSPSVTDRISELPEVAVASGIRVGAAHDEDHGGDLTYVAIDPSTAGELFDIGLPPEEIAALTPSGVLLDDDEAADRGVVVGDRLTWSFLDGRTQVLEVQGIYTEDDLAGRVVVSHALHERSGVDQFDISVYVRGAQGVDEDVVASALAAAVADYPNAEVESKQEYIDSQAAEIDPILNLMYALLALAVLIALLNIANSLNLSIHERNHELGLLRAVGMTRRQTRRCVTLEAVLVATIGILTGIVVGTFFGWSISIVGRGATWNAFVLPIQPLVVIVVLAMIGAALSAIRPAAHAARLDVLRAIASE